MPEPLSPSAAPAAPPLRLVFWETTTRCNLRCRHCRRLDAAGTEGTDAFGTAEALALVDQIAACGKPILVLSGGDPLLRPDLFEIARHAAGRGLPVSLATNGTLLDGPKADAIRAAGIMRVAVSIDGADAATHDAFRALPGSFAAALEGLARLRERAIPFQLNCSISSHNVRQRDELYALARSLGAVALHFFVLVPVGCGLEIADSHRLTAAQVEEFLAWMCDRPAGGGLHLKATCAPQYFRLKRQQARDAQAGGADLPVRPATPSGHPSGGGAPHLNAETRGCLAGSAVCFVSHRGEVFPCGYLPVRAGSVREQPLKEIWEGSPVFAAFRGGMKLEGKCGLCEYRAVCGGCRARAFGTCGSVWGADPYCAYEPAAGKL